MPYTEFLLRRQDGRLCHVDEGIEDLLGWTAEEIIARSIRELVTEASYIEVQETYLEGQPGSYCRCCLTVDALHKQGHVVKVRLLMFCRYGADSKVAEAWGCVKRHSELDTLEAWWPKARREAQGALMQLAKAYAAV